MLVRTPRTSRAGFTLVEILVVIAIILALLGVGMFPYRYYIERGYVEKAADGVAQEWVLAHKSVRNGVLFDVNKHAHILMVLEKGKSDIQTYLLSGSTADMSQLTSSNIKPYHTLSLDGGTEIVGFTGSLPSDTTRVGYLITPPTGSGVFFTGTLSTQSAYLTGVEMIVGYKNAALETGRSRKVLLRPYLQ